MSMRTWCRKKAHYMMHLEGITGENRRGSYSGKTFHSFFSQKWREFAKRGRFEKPLKLKRKRR